MVVAERRTLPLAAVGVAFALVAFFFASRFVLIELAVRRLGAPLLLALAAALAIVGTGAFARRAIDRESAGRLAFDFAAGYPLFGTICYLLGWISTGRAMAVAILLAGVIAGALALRFYRGNGDETSIPLTPVSLAALFLLSLAMGSALLAAQAPPVTLDELAYHLAVPRVWAIEGRVVELPLASHSYFPFGIESADLPFLALLGADGAIASHVLHLIAALAAAALLFSWLRRRCSPVTALAGVAAIATIPALLVTAGISWNDWPLLAIAIGLLHAAYPSEGDTLDRGALAMAIAAGLLTKYTFVAIAAPLLLPLVLRRTRELAYPFIAGCAIGSIYFLRNLLLTGNPVAPFFERLAPAVSGYRASGSVQDLINNYIFEGRFIDESIGVTALVFAAALAVAWRFVESRAMLAAGAGVAVVLVALVALAPSSRILLPFLVVLMLLGIAALEQASPALTRAIAIGGAALQLFLGLHFIALSRPFALLSGAASTREYVLANRPAAGDIEWMDAQVPAQGRVLVVGVNELFWSSRRTRGGGNFDGKRVSAYLAAPDLASRLRGDGITHVAILPRALRTEDGVDDAKARERETVLTREALSSLRDLLQRNVREVASSEGRRVFAVR